MPKAISGSTAITILRLYGPASCAELARAGKVNREALYAALYRLSKDGLVIHRPRRYLLSIKGQERFDKLHSRPLLDGQ